MAALDDLEARVSALEASQADYRAVLAAVNALGANQRDHAERLGRVEKRLDSVDSQLTSVESKLDDTNARVRSLEDTTSEIKDLLIRALERP
jgi:prefoldin subunit 5